MELSGPPVPSVPTRELPARGSSKVHCPSCATSPDGAKWIFAWSLPGSGDNWVIKAIIDRNQKKNDLGHLMSLKTCVLDSLDKSPYVMRLTVMEKWQWCSWSKWYRQQKPNFHPSTSVEHGTHNVVFSNIQDEGVVTMKSSATMQFFVGVFNEPVL